MPSLIDNGDEAPIATVALNSFAYHAYNRQTAIIFLCIVKRNFWSAAPYTESGLLMNQPALSYARLYTCYRIDHDHRPSPLSYRFQLLLQPLCFAAQIVFSFNLSTGLMINVSSPDFDYSLGSP